MKRLFYWLVCMLYKHHDNKYEKEIEEAKKRF